MATDRHLANVADRRAVLTTGEVARICHVAPRTVTKWFDSGQLRGYRIPGSRDRRIPVAHLLAFMRAHGIPLDGLDGGICRVLIVDDSAPDGVVEALGRSERYDVHLALNEFEAGMLAEQIAPHVVVVDAGGDEATAAEICRNIKASPAFGSAKVIATAPDAVGRGGRLTAMGFDAYLPKPYSAVNLARVIEDATNLIP